MSAQSLYRSCCLQVQGKCSQCVYYSQRSHDRKAAGSWSYKNTRTTGSMSSNSLPPIFLTPPFAFLIRKVNTGQNTRCFIMILPKPSFIGVGQKHFPHMRHFWAPPVTDIVEGSLALRARQRLPGCLTTEG